MTAKSIIDVQVNGEAFKEFQALFSKYNTQLLATPTAWANVNKQISQADTKSQSIQDSFSQIADSNREIADLMKKFQKSSADSDSKWKSIAKSTKEVGKTVGGLLGSLLKIAGIGGIFGGLLGIGGLFGLTRLAASAAGQQRSARGLNISPGEQKAFGVNYRQYVDSDSYLSNVNDALQDRTKRWTLYAAGLNEGQLQGKSTAEVGAALLPLLRQKFIQGGRTQQGADAFGLTQFAGMQDLNRLSNASPESLKLAQQQYEVDKRNLDLTDETTQAWTKLLQQLDRASIGIEKTFITALSPLAPQLAKLSSAFSDAIKILASNPDIKGWIDDLAKGIKEFASYMGSKEFKQDVADFAAAVSTLAKKTAGAMRWLGLIPDKSVPVQDSADPTKKEILKGGGITLRKSEYSQTVADALAGISDNIRRKTGAGATYFSGTEAKYGLPRGILRAMEKQESNFNVGAISPKGAMGPFQFMPGTAKQYGLADPFNLDDSAEAAARKMRDLRRNFKGDTEKALAAYNWGEGNVQKDVTQYGDKWKDHLPNETKGYLNQILPGVRVEVNNNTGGSAIISTNSLAQ
jgi:hypothetical protein